MATKLKRVTADPMPFARRAESGRWVDDGVWSAMWIALPLERGTAGTVAYRNRFVLAGPERFLIGVTADAVKAFASSRGDIFEVDYMALLHLSPLWTSSGESDDEELFAPLAAGLEAALA